MFTGIVEELGEITAVENLGDASRFRLRGPVVTDGAKHGDSIAVNGVCLTVVEHEGDEFTADVMAETLDRSSLGALAPGSPVNLERPVPLGGRLGGHLVQGHVDGVGTVLRVEQEGDAWLIDVALPDGLDELMVPHGSVTVDGVSLTVNALPRPGVLQLSIIEYTHRHTTLGLRRPGDRVHVEGDVVGKYVRRLVGPYLAAAAR